MSIVFSTQNFASESNYRRLSKVIFKANQLLNGQAFCSRSNGHVSFQVLQNHEHSRPKAIFFEIGGRWAKQLFYNTHARGLAERNPLEDGTHQLHDLTYLSRTEIQESLGDFSKPHVLRMISSLRKSGILSLCGGGKNTRYKVMDKSRFESYCQVRNKTGQYLEREHRR